MTVVAAVLAVAVVLLVAYVVLLIRELDRRNVEVSELTCQQISEQAERVRAAIETELLFGPQPMIGFTRRDQLGDYDCETLVTVKLTQTSGFPRVTSEPPRPIGRGTTSLGGETREP